MCLLCWFQFDVQSSCCFFALQSRSVNRFWGQKGLSEQRGLWWQCLQSSSCCHKTKQLENHHLACCLSRSLPRGDPIMFKGSETIFSSSAFLRADISWGSCRLRSGAEGAPGLGRSLECTERKFLSKANEGVFAGVVAMISSVDPRLQPTLMDWCCANSSWLCVGISTTVPASASLAIHCDRLPSGHQPHCPCR